MTFRRFALCLVFLVGVGLGWAARGTNDGNRIQSEIKVEVEKAEAVEKARWEKQVRDLDLANGALQDKLAQASARETTINRMQQEIDDLKSKIPTAEKPNEPPAKPDQAEPAKPPATEPAGATTTEPKP